MRTWISRASVVTSLLDRLQPLFLLAARLYISMVFVKSGLVKLSDWSATLALFHDEYKVPFLPPDVAAYTGAFGELAFPLLITTGFMARFGAAGLFVVNAIAVASYPQLFEFSCPAAINFHYTWAAILAALVVFGPGAGQPTPSLFVAWVSLRPRLAEYRPRGIAGGGGRYATERSSVTCAGVTAKSVAGSETSATTSRPFTVML